MAREEQPEEFIIRMEKECREEEKREYDEFSEWLHHPFTEKMMIQACAREDMLKDRVLSERDDNNIYSEYLVARRIADGSVFRLIYQMRRSAVRSGYKGRIRAASREAEAVAIRNNNSDVPSEQGGIFGVGADYTLDNGTGE